MSETITEHEAVEEPVVESAVEAVSDEQLIAMLVDRARTDGLQLTG
ncbi:IS256 family transposase, partial [Streptomyces sp. TRM66268-LWL]|nr:IS256 family transposase [Streptomyces polyasparticus]